jgi:hypothetical protein
METRKIPILQYCADALSLRKTQSEKDVLAEAS